MFKKQQNTRTPGFSALRIWRRAGRPLTQAVLTLCVLCGISLAQDWKTVADGVEHAQVRREFSGKPVDINLLRLDLKKVRLDVHHAMDAAIGLETTSSIAKRHGAFAAINAGFFRMDTSIWAGDAEGTLKVDGNLLSESSKGRVALLIRNTDLDAQIAITQLDISIDLICFRAWKKGRAPQGCPGVGSRIEGINRERRENEAVVYTPHFGRTTLTNSIGLEIVVARGKVTEINSGSGSSVIPPDGFVLSATGTFKEKLGRIRIGDFVSYGLPKIDTYARNPRPNGSDNEKVDYFEDITNGVPQLIKNGKIDITWEQERTNKAFVETRHPRTAVAKLKDGRFLMLTADGRTEKSAGLDLYDLAAYMLELGAVDAMNLDGGGSTTMYLDGQVVNRVSDKEGERKIGDAILVTLRNKRKQ